MIRRPDYPVVILDPPIVILDPPDQPVCVYLVEVYGLLSITVTGKAHKCADGAEMLRSCLSKPSTHETTELLGLHALLTSPTSKRKSASWLLQSFAFSNSWRARLHTSIRRFSVGKPRAARCSLRYNARAFGVIYIKQQGGNAGR